ncbi:MULTISPECIES: MDR family MFS transporter [unclassified Streptomyces]|uniref:MDR family MFS transporter n=1 Tax=unclassified Streptomyces TaxID=2593676 RepID=UPI00210C3565|nr:MDR family MFS transporter [Streptomyces sp. DvalAA-14]
MATVVILGAVMTLLDSTIVNVALRTLGLDLHASVSDVQWVVTAYLLAVAAAIPCTGWLARRLGARRMYLAAVVAFTVGSALCGLSQSLGQLVAARALQGVGGGMVLPIGQMMLAGRAGPKNMARVMSVIGVPIVLAPVFGPTLGGLLLDYADWRWIFYVNVPICVAVVALGLRLLPRGEPERVGRLDLSGLLTVAGGMVAVTYGLAEVGATGGWTSPTVLGWISGGVLLLVVHVLRALRVAHPLLDVRLYRGKVFGAASLSTFSIGAALYGSMILLPLYYQTVRHESPVATGLLIAPSGIGAAVANGLTGRLTERLGSGRTAMIGGLVTMAGTVPFALLGADSPYTLLCPAMALRGFGVGLAMMPAMTAAYATLSREKIADATPQLSVLRQVGGSVGIALFTVVLKTRLDAAGHDPASSAHAFGTTWWWVLAVTGIATLPTLLLARSEQRAKASAAGPAPAAVPEPAGASGPPTGAPQ